MDEYISREAAIVKATKVLADDFDAYNVKVSLQAIPAADVVEVVRCGECRYWGGKYADNECSLITHLALPDIWLKTLPEDFCSSGKRKDGGQDDGTA